MTVLGGKTFCWQHSCKMFHVVGHQAKRDFGPLFFFTGTQNFSSFLTADWQLNKDWGLKTGNKVSHSMTLMCFFFNHFS